VKKGEELEVYIEKFADRGKSVARVDGYVVLVDGGVPGDTVRVRLTKSKKRFAEARLLSIVSESTLRTSPRCAYFGTCGGCKWQHVDYAAQLEAKRASVQESFTHLGGFRDFEVLPTIGSGEVYFYRNKMEFSFSAERWLTTQEIESGEDFDREFALGLHIPGHFSRVLDIRECHLQSPAAVEVLNEVRDFVKARSWKPWDIRKHEGFLRHLVIREGKRTGETMINLVTNGYDEARMEEIGGHLMARFPWITTFVNTVNTGLAQTAFGEEIRTIRGPGVINDMIGDLTFEIAPNAFFQTNTAQAEHLFAVAREMAGLQKDDIVYDLYCGAGAISLFVAGAVRQVVGVELIEEAVTNARRNAEVNGVENCTFIAGDLMRLFTPEFVREHGSPDVLIVDPPRGGMHPRVVEQIARLSPRRLVYVSCNPQTQARDLAMLKEFYRLHVVQPVDMFPHTHHIESVAMLTTLNA
jgi:23S rRNA (uracil1939-C5)-methyltransferase